MLEFLHFLAVFYAFSGEHPRGGGHARSARLKVVSSWGDYKGCETYFDDMVAQGAREIL